MPTVADALRQHADGYLRLYGDRMPSEHKQVLAAITRCRTPSGPREPYSRPVSGNEFVRGFLQHTLPRNFQRLRYYGFASPNSKLPYAWVRMLVWFYLGWCYWLARQTPPEPIEKPPVRWAECGGKMQLTAITDGSGRLLYNHPLPYLDSS